jgi:hypothetical protein
MTPDDNDGDSWRRILTVVVVGLAAIVTVVIVVQTSNRAHNFLIPRHLEPTVFEPAPPIQSAGETIARLWADLHTQAGTDFLNRLLPTESGALWIALIVALVVGVDYSNLRNSRNIELLTLLIVGFLLFDVLRFFNSFTDPTYFRLMDWVFTGIVVTSLWLAGRAVWRVWHPHRLAWTPNLPTRALMLLTIVLLMLNALVVVVREPDDAGFYTNLGGQRLRERGMFPYGDPLLSGTPGAAYGPVLFLAHLPFQWLLDPKPVNPGAPDHPLKEHQAYSLPPAQATQLATLTFHLVGVGALVIAARRLANPQVAWGLAALYCSSVYVIGVGGSREMIGGLTFISHTAAPALALVAFACLSRPLLAGVFLALSVATVFYPLFFIPAWLGYYWRRRTAVLQFLGGLALAALVVGGPVLALSRPIEGRSRLGTIARETLGHHQGSDDYGQTLFGFWGMRTGIRGWLQRELVPQQPMTAPMFLSVATLAALAFFPARKATPQQLALLSGAAAILVDVWKILGTGVYVTWYFAFLLLGFFAYGHTSSPEHRASAASDSPSAI